MPTYRVRAEHCSHSILVEAKTPAEAELFGGLFFLLHGMIDNLSGWISSESWNKSVEHFEYVPQNFFVDIVPQLEAMIAEKKSSIPAALRERAHLHLVSP